MLCGVRQAITEAATPRNVHHGTARPAIDDATANRPKPTRLPPMGGIHAYGHQEKETVKKVAAHWARVYYGDTGGPIDALESRYWEAINTWFRQFGIENRNPVQHFCHGLRDARPIAAKLGHRLSATGARRAPKKSNREKRC